MLKTSLLSLGLLFLNTTFATAQTEKEEKLDLYSQPQLLYLYERASSTDFENGAGSGMILDHGMNLNQQSSVGLRVQASGQRLRSDSLYRMGLGPYYSHSLGYGYWVKSGLLFFKQSETRGESDPLLGQGGSIFFDLEKYYSISSNLALGLGSTLIYSHISANRATQNGDVALQSELRYQTSLSHGMKLSIKILL